jgi:serine/threonine-protein kinase
MSHDPDAAFGQRDDGTWQQFPPEDRAAPPAGPTTRSADSTNNDHSAGSTEQKTFEAGSTDTRPASSTNDHSAGSTEQKTLEAGSTDPRPTAPTESGTREARPNDTGATLRGPAEGTQADPDESTLNAPGPPDPQAEGPTVIGRGAAPTIAPGQVLFEKYQLIKLLGEGGMGQVWLVHNTVLECNRVLKLIWPSIAKHDSGWSRFKREAQLMAKLNHPNAVAVYDFRRIQSVGCIEMEYVRGRSLDKVLEEKPGQPRPLEWIVPILDQLCSVLQEGHEYVEESTGKRKPIIHRDLKPSNLMLVENKPTGQDLKVLDYGIAKMVDEDSSGITLTGAGEYIGTVGYSSPEQIRGGSVKEKRGIVYDLDARSDIYSVGIILYQLLTGVLPFRGSPTNVLAAHLTRTPPPMNEVAPGAGVPPEIERIVLQCLEKEPEKRPQTAGELAERFRAAALAQLGQRREGGRMLRLAVGPVLIGLAAFVLFLARRNPPPPPPPVKEKPASTTSPAITQPEQKPNEPIARNVPRPSPEIPADFSHWVAQGYQPVKPGEVAEGFPSEPKRLKRTADGVEFVRYRPGIYLPDGYQPEDPDELDGDWPRVLVRTRDKDKDPKERARFIRIKGKSFLFGDPRPNPAKGCEPRMVRVGDFYMQESEITNRDIEDYLSVYPEDGGALEQWREFYDIEKENNPDVAHGLAAVGIPYTIARKSARQWNGRLPTDAEWEYVGKSGVDDFRWPWGKEAPGADAAPARLFNPLSPGPSKGKKYPTDKTSKGVYDMAGNVREWCLNRAEPAVTDNHSASSSSEPARDDPWTVAPVNLDEIRPSDKFAVRGGSFSTQLEDAMVFLRNAAAANRTDDEAGFHDQIGFRIVLECPRAPEESVGAE